MKNKNPQAQKVTFNTVMSWIFGVGFIVGGLFSPATTGPAWLILTVCTGIFLLPPFQRMLRGRMHVELSAGACWGIVFVLLVAAGVARKPEASTTVAASQVYRPDAQQATPSASGVTHGPAAAGAKPASAAREILTFGKPTVRRTPIGEGMDVLVEAHNNTDAAVSCTVQAVFKKGDEILGNASGVLNTVPAHGSRTAELSGSYSVKGYDSITLEADTCF